MPFRVDQLKDSECVSLAFTGIVTEEQRYDARNEVDKALSATGWNKLIVDATGITRDAMSLADDYKYTSEHPFTHPIGTCIAVLHRPEEKERYSFIQDVARNRGLDLRIFTDRVKARKWLVENCPPPS